VCSRIGRTRSSLHGGDWNSVVIIGEVDHGLPTCQEEMEGMNVYWTLIEAWSLMKPVLD